MAARSFLRNSLNLKSPVRIDSRYFHAAALVRDHVALSVPGLKIVDLSVEYGELLLLFGAEPRRIFWAGGDAGDSGLEVLLDGFPLFAQRVEILLRGRFILRSVFEFEIV